MTMRFLNDSEAQSKVKSAKRLPGIDRRTSFLSSMLAVTGPAAHCRAPDLATDSASLASMWKEGRVVAAGPLLSSVSKVRTANQ